MASPFRKKAPTDTRGPAKRQASAELGQQPVAFIVLKPGAEETPESLVAWCQDAMAVYKVPEVRLLPAMPMTATGKIKKNELEPLL
ncbi:MULTISPECIES: AMP-binding enzyme [Pseudomonadaceae]|uniref:AMP-binding enzyme n=1 Tax=Pseudomonadaceae TaxID=135621 RepID=UPI001F117727|nr:MULTISPECIES: hypothetical protein [Pseudomonas]